MVVFQKAFSWSISSILREMDTFKTNVETTAELVLLTYQGSRSDTCPTSISRANARYRTRVALARGKVSVKGHSTMKFEDRWSRN